MIAIILMIGRIGSIGRIGNPVIAGAGNRVVATL